MEGKWLWKGGGGRGGERIRGAREGIQEKAGMERERREKNK